MEMRFGYPVKRQQGGGVEVLHQVKSDIFLSCGIPVQEDPRFKAYVEPFGMNNPKVWHKYWHTYRVEYYAETLAESLNLNGDAYQTACLCGLLHDIGRFRQVTEYNTFIDQKSMDHGTLGAEILEKEGIVDRFTTKPEQAREIILATREHNKYTISDELDEEELFFAKLVRDADKLDILHFWGNKAENGEVSREYFDEIMNEKLVHRKGEKETGLDSILGLLSFIYDMNFRKSFEILNADRIIEKKIGLLRKYAANLSQAEIDELAKKLGEKIRAEIS